LGTKEALDKFYTNKDIAEKCATIFNKHAFRGYFEDVPIVEPSAGAGAFAPYVTLMLDILPEGKYKKYIAEQDFFTFPTHEYPQYLGNPPFGRNASLAKKFFNHAAKGEGVIGFILPRTFRKVSVQNALDLNFHLVEDILLPPNSFTLEGKPYSVPCVFQVWKYRSHKREKILLPTTHKDFSFVEKGLEDFAIRRVGGLAGKVLDNGGAISSHYFIQASTEVRKILESLYKEFQEVASNTAGNPSLSKGEMIHIYSSYISKNSS
tara:strand:- start:197 stop:988 length:792 start_codon:yes stop_codon:yes gene_type:complete